MVLAQNRHLDQWNKIKDPNMSTCNFCHLIFDKEAKILTWRKEHLQQMGLEHWMSTCRRMDLDSYLLPCKALSPNRSNT